LCDMTVLSIQCNAEKLNILSICVLVFPFNTFFTSEPTN
jgi:hypothetical protein